MRFIPTPLNGAYVVHLEPQQDERGFFARTWCEREFEQHGLNRRVVQCSISFNLRAGTLRGMHYQEKPHPEVKLVRCTAGTIYDVILDLRRESATYKRWHALELSVGNRLSLYIPEGFAHGFQTLEDNTEVLYQISEFYDPQCARAVRWNDPSFGIRWPLAPTVISEKDHQIPDFKD